MELQEMKLVKTLEIASSVPVTMVSYAIGNLERRVIVYSKSIRYNQPKLAQHPAVAPPLRVARNQEDRLSLQRVEEAVEPQHRRLRRGNPHSGLWEVYVSPPKT